MPKFWLLLVGGLLLPWAPAPLQAQLPSAGIGSLSLGGNGAATRTGVEAIGLNPALLGLPGAPVWSLSLLPTQAGQGVGPITLADLAHWEGQRIPAATRQEWLSRIAAQDGLSGSASAAVTPFALQVGLVALQYSVVAEGKVNLSEGAAELLLFGNAGRTGEPIDLSLGGSGAEGRGYSTLALSVAVPMNVELGPLPDQSFSLGVTLTRTTGHALLLLEDGGGVVGADPLRIEAQMPLIHGASRSPLEGIGSGIGVTAGLAWEGGPFRLSAAMHDLMHTFEWDESALLYLRGEAYFDESRRDSDFDEMELAAAPQELRDRIQERSPAPSLVAGFGWDPSPALSLSADARHSLEEGLSLGPRSHLGMGAEFRGLSFLPLRAGGAWITDGFQLGGGFGVRIGSAELGDGALYRSFVQGSYLSIGGGLTVGLP